MPKKAKKTNSNCEQHLFTLKPKQNYCRFAQPICISFCDQLKDKNKTKSKKCKNSSCLDCPVFNKDRNFATPTFILNSQKQYYEERGQRMRDQHEKKMIEYTDEKDSLNIPKPRTKNNFCSVCRQVYEDYLQHIQSQRHKKKINSSHFNRYILEIAQKFNPSSKALFNCSHHTLSTRIQDDVEILQGQTTKKKIKLDTDYHQRPNIYSDFLKPNVLPPPPHLDINHTGYFPRYNPELGLFSNSIPQISLAPQLNPPLTFNYNMNIFMNPYNYPPFMPQPFGYYNHMMQYRPNPFLNHIQFPRLQPNIFTNEQNRAQILQKNQVPFLNGMSCGKQIKKQVGKRQKSQIIIIDDDQDCYPNQNYEKNQ